LKSSLATPAAADQESTMKNWPVSGNKIGRLSAGVLAVALGATSDAYAECPTTQGLPATFAYGSVAVSGSLGVGDPIPGTVQAFTIVGKCSLSSLYSKPVVACPQNINAVPGMTGVYPTNVAGVGMRMRDAAGKPMVGTNLCSTDSQLGMTGADGSFNVSGTFELVKTGAVSSGAIKDAYYLIGVLNTGYTLNNGNMRMSVPDGTPIRGVTCSVTTGTANQTVLLATVTPAMFPAAGATAARTSFSIGLNCQAGVNVSITFAASSGASGVPSVLANTGTAKGIGAQLLDPSQTPIVLGSPVRLTESTSGNVSFQFYAQYYRLGAEPVSPGSVSAAAIFTMSYE
jgi:type 1 fimbria pilin